MREIGLAVRREALEPSDGAEDRVRHLITSELSAASQIFPVKGLDQGVDSPCLGKAPGVAVLCGITSEVLNERNPVGVPAPVVAKSRPGRIDGLSTLFAYQPGSLAHGPILKVQLSSRPGSVDSRDPCRAGFAPMDRAEAREVAQERLAELHTWPYDRLVSELLNKPLHETRVAGSGNEYPVETQGFWDDPHRPGLLRVMVCADPGGRRWLPRSLECDDFIIRPDDTFVGE